MKINEKLKQIISTIRHEKKFLITTHKDPDTDGIASMLAFGRALKNAGKNVTLMIKDPLPHFLCYLTGADQIIHDLDHRSCFDVICTLDCSDLKRLGKTYEKVRGKGLLINIDHHETNDLFGTLNYVDGKSSSTGELIYRLIKAAKLKIDQEIAENLFASIQADTGSFRYENTTSSCLNIAAELMTYGVNPWEISYNVMEIYSVARLKLLELGLGTMEYHQKGKIGMMTLSLDMFKASQTERYDSERFTDFPRFVKGVELGVLVRQMEDNEFKFSLRSNKEVNVAQLASRFGGGGHAKAAGFECSGSLNVLKDRFLKEAIRFINGTAH